MSLTLNLPTANGRLQPYTLSGASAHAPAPSGASWRDNGAIILVPDLASSTGTPRSRTASACGAWGSASPRQWTPRSAAWGSTGRPRSS